jgi:predicted nucleic acid-binding protein
MILVDSSVWIDYFRGVRNRQTEQLDKWLDQAETRIGVADLVVFEVLRGFTSEKERQVAKRLLLTLEVVEIGGWDAALQAAEHYVQLRNRGYTIASPIDVLLASYCITHDHLLLHRDTDFDVLKTLSGLKTWPH